MTRVSKRLLIGGLSVVVVIGSITGAYLLRIWHPYYGDPTYIDANLRRLRTCASDGDCEMNTCNCTAVNRYVFPAAQRSCTPFCAGTPKCLNGLCTLVNVVFPKR